MERITEIKRLLSQRPLMLPAIIAVITCISSYLTGSVIPSVVISLCLIAAGATFLKADHIYGFYHLDKAQCPP